MAAVRRLTAILAADVAGYSRLMGADEEGTHERLKAHLRELVDPKIEEHRGRIVKNTGDGMLAEFSSVVDAVRCAAEVQRAMADRNAETPEDKRITFRVGINLGDVIAEPDDIYGDGVNVAARLEALAEPGGICISRVVRDQIRDKLPYPFEDKGEQSVKNIARSVRVFALRPEAIAELPATSVPVGPPRRRRAVPWAVVAAALAALVVLAVIAWWGWSGTRSSSDWDGTWAGSWDGLTAAKIIISRGNVLEYDYRGNPQKGPGQTIISGNTLTFGTPGFVITLSKRSPTTAAAHYHGPSGEANAVLVRQ